MESKTSLLHKLRIGEGPRNDIAYPVGGRSTTSPIYVYTNDLMCFLDLRLEVIFF